MNPIVRFRNLAVSSEERVRLLDVLDTLMQRGDLILGSDVESFEHAFAAMCQRDHCVGVGSGTSALYLALRAWGVGPGDEVITSAMSWVATANAILAVGAVPVFADVDVDFNLDPSSADGAVTSRTKAVLPVHYYGRVAQMDALVDMARRRDLLLLEDAAQAYGATYQGLPAGSFGDAAAFSLNPMKSLASLGEAGAVVTNDEQIAARVRSLRNLGMIDADTCVDPSLNHKIDTLQATVLLARMPFEKTAVEHRRWIAGLYSEGLSDVVQVPRDVINGTNAFFEYTILCENRDRLELALLQQGIEVKVRHRTLLVDQPGYRTSKSVPIPRARRFVDRILSLPIHTAMDERQVKLVIGAVRKLSRG